MQTTAHPDACSIERDETTQQLDSDKAEGEQTYTISGANIEIKVVSLESLHRNLHGGTPLTISSDANILCDGRKGPGVLAGLILPAIKGFELLFRFSFSVRLSLSRLLFPPARFPFLLPCPCLCPGKYFSLPVTRFCFCSCPLRFRLMAYAICWLYVGLSMKYHVIAANFSYLFVMAWEHPLCIGECSPPKRLWHAIIGLRTSHNIMERAKPGPFQGA